MYQSREHYAAAQGILALPASAGEWYTDHVINPITTNSAEGVAQRASNLASYNDWARWNTGAVGWTKNMLVGNAQAGWEMAGNAASGIKHTIAHPIDTANAGIDNVAHFISKGMIERGNSSMWNYRAWWDGAGYIAGGTIGARDIDEAVYGVDILTDRELSTMERWQRGSSGVSKLAFSASGLASSYDNILVSGRLDSSVSFYTVQGSDDALRLASGGEPWPTGATRAHLGQGLYAWDDEATALSYQGRLSGRGVNASVLEIRASNVRLGKLSTMDVTRLDDAVANAFLGRYSYLYADDAASVVPHGFDHVIRQAGMGTEHFFSPAAFKNMSVGGRQSSLLLSPYTLTLGFGLSQLAGGSPANSLSSGNTFGPTAASWARGK